MKMVVVADSPKSVQQAMLSRTGQQVDGGLVAASAIGSFRPTRRAAESALAVAELC